MLTYVEDLYCGAGLIMVDTFPESPISGLEPMIEPTPKLRP